VKAEKGLPLVTLDCPSHNRQSLVVDHGGEGKAGRGDPSGSSRALALSRGAPQVRQLGLWDRGSAPQEQ
jgi:hypothetical protein